MPVRPPRSSLPTFRPLIPPHVAELAARIPRPRLPPSQPFFRLEEHRAPTRALYRHLIRATRSPRSHVDAIHGNSQLQDSLEALRDGLRRKKVLELRPWVITAGMPGARRAKKADMVTWLAEHPSAIPPEAVSESSSSSGSTPPISSVQAVSASTGGFPFIRQWLAGIWRAKKGFTSIPLTRAFLEEQYDLLSQLQELPRPMPLVQLEERLAAKSARREAYLASQAEEAAMTKPTGRLTGGFLRPTVQNGPLPRIKPQPLGLSMMIHNRLRARERRQAARRVWVEHLADMRYEVDFLFRLGVRTGGWHTAMLAHVASLDEKFTRENKRAESRFDEGMVTRVKRARARRTRSQQERAKQRKVADATPTVAEGSRSA